MREGIVAIDIQSLLRIAARHCEFAICIGSVLHEMILVMGEGQTRIGTRELRVLFACSPEQFYREFIVSPVETQG